MDKLPKKDSFIRFLWVFFYFFIFTLLLRGSFDYLDPDLGWHLKVGEEIVASGAVPDINHYNFTFTGRWVDHEWLSNVAVHEIYSHAGYIALSVMFALFIVGVLVFLNVWVRRAYPKVSPFFLILFQTLGVVASLPHFGVRMQESGLVLLASVLWIIYHYDRHRDWRILLAFVPIMYLWACLHGSFLIGFIMFFAWLSAKMMERLLYNCCRSDRWDFSRLLGWKEAAVFAAISLLSFAATFFTPYGIRLYSFLGGYKDNFYQTHIQEWLPQYQYPFHYGQLLYLALVVLGLIFYIRHSRGKGRLWRLDMWNLVLAAIFLILSFKSHRHFPLMFVATFLMVVPTYSSIFSIDGSRQGAGSSWLAGKWMKGYLLFCLFLASLSQLVATDFTSTPFMSFRHDYPVSAADFLEQRRQYDDARLLNDYGWGGYLIYRFPERQIFIDGRLPQVEYRGQTFLEEYFDLFKKRTDIRAKLEEYDIDLILLPVKDQEIIPRRWEQVLFGLESHNIASHNYLRDYLEGSADWQSAYRDQTAVIYERTK